MNVGLVAAILGLAILIAADQFGAWNKRKYRSDTAAGQASADAFRRNRRRKAAFDRVAFGVLVFAAVLSTYSAFADKRSADAEITALKTRLSSLESQFSALDHRVQAGAEQTRQLEVQQQQAGRSLDDMARQNGQVAGRLASLESHVRVQGARARRAGMRTRNRTSTRGVPPWRPIRTTIVPVTFRRSTSG